MKRLLLMVLLWGVTAGAAAAERQVYFYNWSEYLPEAVLAQFTKESGIKVVYTTYDSNEALYAKLKLLKGGGYDLVVPSAYFVSKMSREGMLQPLDLLRLGNLKNLDASRRNQPFDPGNRFSVPYLWGSTGIVAAADAATALQRWIALPAGAGASLIGEVNAGPARVGLHAELGRQRILEELEDGPLPRIC